ncbi:TadE/TadG family type IV pilus assembly protein [Aestuariivirga sp.]|uniref:TadE/TadG family type IV pilus assembly protein n=1 Tax=Aestuariivirga sp. TaxID=2650926 RepID=UPI0039192E46
MRSVGLASDIGHGLRNDDSGATFVEFTVVFPLAMVIVLGCVDAALLMTRWASYGRATYAGARYAVVSSPVATGVNAPTQGTVGGTACFKYDTGEPTGNCTEKPATVCIASASSGSGTCCPLSASGPSCTANYQWNETAFAAILSRINSITPLGPLDRRQVQVIYQPLGLSYALRPVGSPMNVTVQVRCVTHQFYFLQPLLGWAFGSLPPDCAGINQPVGIALPTFTTTLPSEDLAG